MARIGAANRTELVGLAVFGRASRELPIFERPLPLVARDEYDAQGETLSRRVWAPTLRSTSREPSPPSVVDSATTPAPERAVEP